MIDYNFCLPSLKLIYMLLQATSTDVRQVFVLLAYLQDATPSMNLFQVTTEVLSKEPWLSTNFDVFLTVHHNINLFYLPTWCTISLFCNMCITLNTSTCFEQYHAHPQEAKILFLQHLVSSLSMSGRAVQQLRADCSPLSTGALHGRVTIPDAVKIQFWPPEDEHSIARNMSRYLV
jgi:hypothetical protein